MQDLVVSFQEITVRNSNQTVFQQLSFAIHKGEHWALIGSSNSGNKALLDTLAGKYSITGGQVNYPFYDEFIHANQVEDPLFGKQRLIAQVSFRHHFKNLSNTSTFYYQQRYNSFDADDALDVETYLRNPKQAYLKGAWSLDKVKEELWLGSLYEKKLISLSNGETKRVLIAAALLHNPKILLLDNPMAGLDAATRTSFNGLLTKVAATGISIIITCEAEDVPDAITNIALFKNASIIDSFATTGNFKDRLVATDPPTLDLSELKALLSITPEQPFDRIVELNNIVISYGNKVILDRISWKILQGEHWALTGRNGAGKTTLLSLLTGDNPQAYANNITLFDRKRGSGESIWDIKRKIGFISPELFQYFPGDITCLQVVESGFYDTMGLFKKSDPQKLALVMRWMKLLEIENIGTQLFKQVAPALQRLCLLARALVKNPPLLILDEPFQGFDKWQRDYFKNILDNICLHRTTTIIFVSHYEGDIPQCVNRKLVLSEGKVVEMK